MTRRTVLQRATSIVGTLTVGTESSSTPTDSFSESNRVGDHVVTGLDPGTYRLSFGSTCCSQAESYEDATLATATDIVVTRDHWRRADGLLETPS